MLIRGLKVGCLAVLLLLLIVPDAWAGSPRHMAFDGVTIRLGQASEHALKQLHGVFDLQPVAGQSGVYTVQTKDKTRKLLGTVTFQNGSVTRLERDRGSVFDIGQGKIMTTLTKELANEHNTNAEVSIEKVLRNGVTQEIITLKMPGKRILITISDSPSGNGQVNFREILE